MVGRVREMRRLTFSSFSALFLHEVIKRPLVPVVPKDKSGRKRVKQQRLCRPPCCDDEKAMEHYECRRLVSG